ncbi:MAG TPA: alpha/beta hydrolase [Gemmatimonadales bacterium]|nr:alpha/beta hydrolase [Gemmatimonadales bacterium]
MTEELHRTVRGVQLFERRVGSGPPVVVLHGGPGAHHDYLLPGFDALAEGRTLIYYDQRGGGRSAVERDVPVGWQEQVADLEALREAWQMDQLVLVGYSWGALLALLYAIEHPARVERLALVSPAPAHRAARAEFEQRLATRNADPAIMEERQQMRDDGLATSDPERYKRRSFELSVAGYFHDPARATDLTSFRVTGRTQQEVWESLGEYDLRPALAKLSLPAIVLHGASDPIPAETAEETAALLGAEFHRLAASGHVPYVEAPAEFRRLLDEFLPRTGSSRG